MPTPAQSRTSRARRTRNSTSLSSLLAAVVVIALLTLLSTGSAGGSAASLQDTTSGELLTAQAASIQAVHTIDASKNKDFSAGNLTNLNTVTVTNSGTIDATFTTSTTLAATQSRLATAITVTLWQTATAGGCATPVNPVSGRWGDASLKVSGNLPPLASVVICVRTTISDLPNQKSGEFLTTTVSTLLSRSTWTSTVSSTVAQKYQDGPPSAPSALAFGGTTGNSTKLSWAPSTDDVGVTGYDVYRNDASGRILLGQTTSPEFSVTGLASDSTYTFTVIARDGAAHSSSPAQVTVTTLDVTPPNVAPVLTGTASSNVSETTASLTWTAAVDSRGIAEYQIFSGTTKIGTVNGSTRVFSVVGLVAGTTYSYSVRAVDPSGNATSSNPVSLALPPAALKCSEPWYAPRSADLSWSKPAGISGTPRYEVVVNGIVVATTTGTTATLTRDLLDSYGVSQTGSYSAQIRIQGQTAPIFGGSVRLGTVWIILPLPAVACE